MCLAQKLQPVSQTAKNKEEPSIKSYTATVLTQFLWKQNLIKAENEELIRETK